jgi:hypothetical protein
LLSKFARRMNPRATFTKPACAGCIGGNRAMDKFSEGGVDAIECV